MRSNDSADERHEELWKRRHALAFVRGDEIQRVHIEPPALAACVVRIPEAADDSLPRPDDHQIRSERDVPVQVGSYSNLLAELELKLASPDQDVREVGWVPVRSREVPILYSPALRFCGVHVHPCFS